MAPLGLSHGNRHIQFAEMPLCEITCGIGDSQEYRGRLGKDLC